MTNILQEIYQHKIVEVRNRKKILSLTDICQKLKADSCKKIPNPKYDFYQTLKKKNDAHQLGLICEIKRGSPSAGILQADLDVAKTAKAYENYGASCISVLTDEKYFFSQLDYLLEARKSCDLPILRKDFMVDPYQIYESKMMQADCILLIVAMLSDNQLKELEEVAISLNLSVLIEVHNLDELQRAMQLKSKLIGINNRDLKTLKIDLNTTLKLQPYVPKDAVLVCESGIKSMADLENFRQNNINCFLIGEYFMRGGKI